MSANTIKLDWERRPLIPAIVQDIDSRQVLMLGYMNRAALAMTHETGLVTFYSRSRRKLWTKGDTSGNTLVCKRVYPDCDGDTLLVLAKPTGPTCHRDTVACFDENYGGGAAFLDQLQARIRRRIDDGGEHSYVAGLRREGVERMAQKVGEEGIELAIAAVAGRREATVSEAADLLFHMLVLLTSRDHTLNEVVGELRRRADRAG